MSIYFTTKFNSILRLKNTKKVVSKMEPPSFKHLRPENYNKLDSKQLESLENLTKFHVDSFDWMLDQGLRHAIKVSEPLKTRF